jgi:hypothetical protein
VIHILVDSIWGKEELPGRWKESVIVPVHGKSDTDDCSNYCETSLLSTSYKMLSDILLWRLSPYIDEIIGDTLCGYRHKKSTTDQKVLYSILIGFGIPMKLVRLIKMYMSESFPIQNGLKQGDALLPLLFNFALDYAIRKVRNNQLGLKLNGTHQLLAYTDEVNLVGVNIDSVKRNTGTLIGANEEVGLDINVEKTKYTLVPHYQKAGQIWDIKIGNR